MFTPDSSAHGARKIHCTAQRIGAIASALIARHSTGVILAVFDRCIYLRLLRGEKCHRQCGEERASADIGYESDNALVCITDTRLGAGPLQICVSDLQRIVRSARPRIEAGARVVVAEAVMTIHARQTGNENALAVWTVSCAGVPAFAAVAKAAECPDPQRALRRLIDSSGVAVGVAPGLHDSFVHTRSAQPLRVLFDWLSQATPGGKAYGGQSSDAALPEDVAQLIGLGLGLTPAGDDYLAGVFIGLRYCRRDEAATKLSGFLATHLEQRTNRISRAHLACVRAGLYQEIIIDLLAAVDEFPWRVESAVQRLIDFGHTSGLDLLGGFAAALDSSR